MVAVGGWSGSLLRWERELTELKDRLAPVFVRSEVRRSAGAFIDGVLSGIARKPVGNWRSRQDWVGRIGCSHCLGEVVGMPMPCVIWCAMR